MCAERKKELILHSNTSYEALVFSHKYTDDGSVCCTTVGVPVLVIHTKSTTKHLTGPYPMPQAVYRAEVR